jgi:hypothetical protein
MPKAMRYFSAPSKHQMTNSKPATFRNPTWHYY